MKRHLMIATAAALLLAASSATATGLQSQEGAAGRCTIAGSWYGNSEPFVFLITLIPVDNAHQTFVVIADADASTPTVPESEEITAFHGTVERTGPRTFVQSSLAYVRGDGDVGWIATFAVNGAWELTGDCDTAEVVWEGAAFGPGSDPFDGGVVGACVPPVTGTFRRIPVAPIQCLGP